MFWWLFVSDNFTFQLQMGQIMSETLLFLNKKHSGIWDECKYRAQSIEKYMNCKCDLQTCHKVCCCISS